MYTSIEPTACPASVIRTDPESRIVWIQRDDHDFEPIPARIAIAPPVAIESGDTVLVTGNEDPGMYVIGVLEQPAMHEDRQIELRCGTRVEARGNSGSETIRVISKSGELLFEYDEATRRTSVHLQPGDVEFVAREGTMRFAAEHGIQLSSETTIQVNGKRGVGLASEHASLMLSSHAAHLAGPHVAVKTPTLDVQAVESSFTGRKLLSRIGRVRLITETLEAVFGNVVQKAKNVFRRIGGLDEVHTKHSRTVVEESQHLKAGTVNVKADGDVRIDGEQIHLG